MMENLIASIRSVINLDPKEVELVIRGAVVILVELAVHWKHQWLTSPKFLLRHAQLAVTLTGI